MSMTLIATITVGSGGAGEMKFSSIPSTFTDLLVVYSIRTGFSSVYQQIPVYFNNDSSNTTGRNLLGTGSGASSDSASFPQYAATAANATSNTFSNGQVYVPNYAGSTTKSFSVDVVTENNATNAGQTLFAGLWNSTAAINTLQLWGASQTMQQHSSASLYGITKGSGGATVS
jgi:hypothetical protein